MRVALGSMMDGCSLKVDMCDCQELVGSEGASASVVFRIEGFGGLE